MSRVIVVTSGKGGVGKTTLTANIGVALAMQNLRVCLIDADLGLKNLDAILGIEGRVVYDMQDVIENRCELNQAIVKDKRLSNLHIIPACKNLDVQTIDFSYIQRIVNQVKPNYDYVLIDSPAGIERGFFNAIKTATEALVVVTLDIASIRDADKVVALINRESIQDVKLIINRVEPDRVNSHISLSVDDALEVLSIPLFGIVYEEPTVISGNNHGVPAVLDERSLARKSFTNIARRLQGEKVDIVKYKKKGLLARIFS